MPFKDKKEILKGGTLCIDGEEIEILGSLEKRTAGTFPASCGAEISANLRFWKKAVKHGNLESD